MDPTEYDGSCRSSSTGVCSSVLEELRKGTDRLREEAKLITESNLDSLTCQMESPVSTYSPSRNPFDSPEAGDWYKPVPQQSYPNTNPFAHGGEPCRSPWSVRSEVHHQVDKQCLPPLPRNEMDDPAGGLEEVFRRHRSAGLKLKPSKCNLFRTEVEYLAHFVSAAGIQTDPAKVEAVKNWPIPKTQTEVRSFIGLASYYRRFIKDFTDVARPLLKLTEKNIPFQWDSSCDDAFQELKTALTSAPILAYPSAIGQFTLDTDASAFAVGAVLSQEQEGEERVVAYASKSLKMPERNYCVTRRELFKHYLCGVEEWLCVLSLRWLCRFKNPEGQLARWLEILGSFGIQLIHRPGRLHQNADGLSRRPCPQCGRVLESGSSLEDDIPSKIASDREQEVATSNPAMPSDCKDCCPLNVLDKEDCVMEEQLLLTIEEIQQPKPESPRSTEAVDSKVDSDEKVSVVLEQSLPLIPTASIHQALLPGMFLEVKRHP